MPYRIEQRDEQYCVVVEHDGRVVGCHETEEAALQQLQAIGIHAGKATEECLQRKIPHLLQAGYPREQAIAIAFSECEGKAFDELTPDEQQLVLTAWEPFAQLAQRVWECPQCLPRKAAETSSDERLIALGSALKALDQTDSGRVGGYLVVFGSPDRRDLQGEFFTPQTELGLDMYKSWPVLYHHGLDETLGPSRIGEIDVWKLDEIGLWIEAQLDMADRYAAAVYHRLVKPGKTGLSSGTMPHWRQVKSTGEIVRWPIVEGSITVAPAFPPIYDHSTRILPLKALPNVVPLEGLISKEEGARVEPAASVKLSATIDASARTVEPPPESNEHEEQQTMDMQAMVAKILDVLASMGLELSDEQKEQVLAAVMADMQPPAVEAVVTPQQAEAFGKALSEAVIRHANTVLAQARALDSAQAAAKGLAASGVSQVPTGYRHHGTGTVIEVRSRYHELSPEDMSYYAHTRMLLSRQRALGGQGWKPDALFLRELADKASKAFTNRQIYLNADAVKAVNLVSDLSVKADELDHSTQTSYGDEWVPTLWLDQLWERVRRDNVIASAFDVIEMPSDPYELPIESTDPTVYLVPETKDEDDLTLAGSGNPIPDSKIGTGKVTLQSKKLALRVGFSAEMEEDSIIPLIPQFRRQAERVMQDAIDHVVLNGDTATSGNINFDGGTPGATEKYLAFDGLRKLPLVTNTANSKDAAGAAPTLSLARAVRFLLSPHYSTALDRLAWFTNAETYAKLLDMDAVTTVDKYGSQATVVTGELGRIDNIPLFVSAEFPLTDTDGKVTYNAAGTVGGLLIVHRNSWFVGFRRRITTSVEYLPYYDSYQMVATVRVGLVRRDTNCAALLYNVGV